MDIKCKPSEHVIYSDKTFGSFLYDELNRRFLGFTKHHAISTKKMMGVSTTIYQEDYKLLYLGYNSLAVHLLMPLFADGHQKVFVPFGFVKTNRKKINKL